MPIKWKSFRITYPRICTNCGELSNMEREYCEFCGAKDTLRETKKEDYLKFIEK